MPEALSPIHPALIHLAVALDGAGWHPAAWREAGARPKALFTPGYWADLVQEAESGLLDFVTIEDGARRLPCRLRGDDPSRAPRTGSAAAKHDAAAAAS